MLDAQSSDGATFISIYFGPNVNGGKLWGTFLTSLGTKMEHIREGTG